MGSPKEYYQVYNKKYYALNKEKELSRVKQNNWKLKQIALFIYSDGKMCCALCGFDDIDCLEIDHINNNGSKHRKKNPKFSKQPYQQLQKTGYPSGFQVLCRNCNWKKYLKEKS